MDANKICNFNLENFILRQWQKISPLTKRAVLWIFLITNFVFLFHTLTFFWGDHDWNRMVKGVYPIPISGRFLADMPLWIFGGDILPILNNVFAFLGFSLATVYLAKYWKIPKSVFSYVVFGLFIILMPYTLPWMWYAWQTADFWLLFGIFYGLYQIQSDRWWNHLIFVGILLVSMQVFQSIFSTAVIVFLGKCLLDLNIEHLTIRKLIKKHYKTGIDILFAGIISFVLFVYLKQIGIIPEEDYHTKFVAMTDLKAQIIETLSAIRDEFWLASAYMPTFFKRLLFIPMILSVFFICYRKNWKTILLNGIILCVILLSGQIVPFLAEKNLFRFMRLNFFSFPYIYALACVILFSQKEIFKSVATAIMIVALFFSILGDIRCQKVWYLAKQAEVGVYREIITRLHTHPDFDLTKKYKLVSIGKIHTQKYFDRYNKKAMPQDEFKRPFAHKKHPQSLLNFMERKRYITAFIEDYLSEEQIKTLDKDYLLNKAKAWPHPDSVTIIDDTIYLIMEKKKLKQLQKQLRKINTK